MKKLFVRYLIYFDRARRYLSIVQTIMVLSMSLKIFNFSAIWYYMLIPVIIVASLIVGYFDTRWGIREEEARNNNGQNPEIRRILALLEGMKK